MSERHEHEPTLTTLTTSLMIGTSGGKLLARPQRGNRCLIHYPTPTHQMGERRGIAIGLTRGRHPPASQQLRCGLTLAPFIGAHASWDTIPMTILPVTCGARTQVADHPCRRKPVPGRRRCPNHGGMTPLRHSPETRRKITEGMLRHWARRRALSFCRRGVFRQRGEACGTVRPSALAAARLITGPHSGELGSAPVVSFFLSLRCLTRTTRGQWPCRFAHPIASCCV